MKILKSFGIACILTTLLTATVGSLSVQAVDYTNYTTNDLIFLARIINTEASDLCDDEHKQLVGSVVMNRVKDSRFPNTIWNVAYQKGQYTCINDKKFWGQYPSQRSIQAAKNVLDKNFYCPSTVVYQSEAIQGKGIYKIKIVNTRWRNSITYFCYS